jgi:hypothetical protein
VATRREKIIQRCTDVLNGAGKPTGITYDRYRAHALERSTQLPRGIVYPVTPPLQGQSETVQRLDHDSGVERKLNLRVEHGVQDDQPDQALDPFYAWGVRALRADFLEGTLADLCSDLEEKRTDFQAAMGDAGPIGVCATEFEITYLTDEDDPEEGAY